MIVRETDHHRSRGLIWCAVAWKAGTVRRDTLVWALLNYSPLILSHSVPGSPPGLGEVWYVDIRARNRSLDALRHVA